MIPGSWRSLRTIATSFCFILLAACRIGGGDGDDGSSARAEAVIGPAGGTLEITEPGTSMTGLKLTVPAGAVSQATTFSMEFAWDAPKLPAGLSQDYPLVQFGPAATTFSTYLEITFPVTYLPTGEGHILGAYCWNPTKGRWVVNPARRVDGYRMTVSTNQLGLCRWGTVRLGEVDDETVKAWMEDLQGMVDDWAALKAQLLAELQPFIAILEQPSTFYKCSAQISVLETLASWRQGALAGVTAYLQSAPVKNACTICDLDGTCLPSVCDANAIISGQPLSWVQKEIQIWVQSMFISSACPVDALAPLVEKLVSWAKYQEAIRELSCDWRCILKNGTPGFYGDLLLGNVCSFSIFAIELWRSNHTCT